MSSIDEDIHCSSIYHFKISIKSIAASLPLLIKTRLLRFKVFHYYHSFQFPTFLINAFFSRSFPFIYSAIPYSTHLPHTLRVLPTPFSLHISTHYHLKQQWIGRYNKKSVTTNGIFNLNFAIYIAPACPIRNCCSTLYPLLNL